MFYCYICKLFNFNGQKSSSCEVIYCLVKGRLIGQLRIVVTCCVMGLFKKNNKSLCLTIYLVVWKLLTQDGLLETNIVFPLLNCSAG